MNNNRFLSHFGIPGMRWGKRKSRADILKDNTKLKEKLDKTVVKSEKNKVKIDKLTTKLTKHGRYITSIGEAMAKSTGRKLARKLAKDKRLAKKMEKIKSKIEANKTLIKDMKTENVNKGKAAVASMLKK